METSEKKEKDCCGSEGGMQLKVRKAGKFAGVDKDKATIVVLAVLIFALGGWIAFENSPFVIVKKDSLNSASSVSATEEEGASSEEVAALAEKVVPSEGYEIPVKWGDLGKQLIEKGVIDEEKFKQLYEKRGELSDTEKNMLFGNSTENIKITSENSGFILNMLWALGLGNKSAVLDKGPMVDKKYGGADKFASTGGWSLSKGKVMDHYSKHAFVALTSEQAALFERVSKGIYRPCCGNSTYFPDCNHGMAMLALLQLLASQGASEKQMYDVALKVNSYWFPDTYMTIAKYFEKSGTQWKDVDAKTVLGVEYSSASGFKAVQQKVNPVQSQKGGGCGV